MEEIYILAEWTFGDHLPYYELVSIHETEDAALDQYKRIIDSFDKVKEYQDLSESEGMVAGATYIKNEGAIFVNDLIVYEVEVGKRIKLTNIISINQ